MKTPGESGRFHFLVEAAGIEPASENRSIEASTCLACVLLSSVSAPTGRVAHQPALWFSPPLPRAGEEGPAHLYDALPYPVSEAREAWLLVRQPVPIQRWQLCFSHRFYEDDGTSACHLYQPRPRRNRYAPLRRAAPPFVVNGSSFMVQSKDSMMPIFPFSQELPCTLNYER